MEKQWPNGAESPEQRRSESQWAHRRSAARYGASKMVGKPSKPEDSYQLKHSKTGPDLSSRQFERLVETIANFTPIETKLLELLFSFKNSLNGVNASSENFGNYDPLTLAEAFRKFEMNGLLSQPSPGKVKITPKGIELVTSFRQSKSEA